MYDTDEETEASQYSSELCPIRVGQHSYGTVRVLRATAEHVLERLELLQRTERAAFEAAVRIAHYRFPQPPHRTRTENDMVRLLIEERILLCEEQMEQDVRYVIYAATGRWQRRPVLRYTELHEILAS